MDAYFSLIFWGPHCAHLLPECPFPNYGFLCPRAFPFPLGGGVGCLHTGCLPPRTPLALGASAVHRVQQPGAGGGGGWFSGTNPVLVSSIECVKGTVGTLLLENPPGQNGLTHQGLLYEAAKVFGLRSRKLKLFLNETQTDGEDTCTQMVQHWLHSFTSVLLLLRVVFFNVCF